MKKRIIAGVTQDDEIYFLEIDPTNDKRNGYDEFTMSGFTVLPLELEEAKERSWENIKSLVEDETEDINQFYLKDIDDIVQSIVDSDGNLSGIDTSLFPEDVTIDGNEYVFESGSCGQHEEKDLKHYLIDKSKFNALMTLWEQYHMKATPTHGMAKAVLDNALDLEQDINDLARQATQFIVFNK